MTEQPSLCHTCMVGNTEDILSHDLALMILQRGAMSSVLVVIFFVFVVFSLVLLCDLAHTTFLENISKTFLNPNGVSS